MEQAGEYEFKKRYNDARFPQSVLVITLFLFLGIVAWLSYQLYNQYQEFNQTLNQVLMSEQLAHQITLYEEILAGTAKLSAARGDTMTWERYGKYEVLLKDVLQQSEQVIPQSLHLLSTGKILQAHEILIDIEHEAFRACRQLVFSGFTRF